MSSSTLPRTTAAKHGGSRSVLCWQEKLSQIDESAIIAFLAKFNCGCKRNCSDKIRAMGEIDCVKMIRDLRTARMTGHILIIT